MTITSARRRARLPLLLTGSVAGAALVLAAPLAASAHVHVDPDGASAGAKTRLGFSFSHGCEDSPTTSVVFTIPDQVQGVTPVLDGSWTITRVLGDDGIPDQVTYTAITPVESGTAATISLDVIFAPSAADTSVAFPVLQKCATGETDWSEVAADGQSEDDLASPAPVVAVGAAAAAGGDHHGSASGAAGDHGSDGGSGDASATEADPVARWLSGGALVAAVAALAVTLIGRRRRA